VKPFAAAVAAVVSVLVAAAPAGGAPPLASGAFYTLSARHSGQCLDVQGASPADGAPVIQWPCHGNGNQTWQLVAADGAFFRLVAQHSGKCLDVAGASLADGARVIQWTCHGLDNQLWRIDARGDGSHTLIAKGSGKCLDVFGASLAGGSELILWTCHGQANQSWVLKAPVILAAGDISHCAEPWRSGAQATAGQVSEQIAQNPLARVLALGDLAYEGGSPSDFRCYDSAWGGFRAVTYPVPGNHEYYASGTADGYFAYFGARAAPPKGYYSFDWAGWHFVALNSECDLIGGCGPGSPQETWLRSDLAANSARCTLVYWHRPRFSSGPHGSDPRFVPFWNALVAAGADIVLNGHDHVYERFAPQDAQGTPLSTGPVEFVVGTGGRGRVDGSGLYPLSNPRAANSVSAQNWTIGVLRLELGAGSYSWRFLPLTATFSDSGDGTCN